MNTVIFDGRDFSFKKEKVLKKEVERLINKGVVPKLVSIIVGDDPASCLYVSLKKKAAERVGCILEIESFKDSPEPEEIMSLITKLNSDPTVHGIMVQLPLPEVLEPFQHQILNKIAPEKDVDGLRGDSNYLPAAAYGVLEIIKLADLEITQTKKVVVVGATGMVGKPLVRELKDWGYEVVGCDFTTENISDITQGADILVAATGIPNLVKGGMVKKNAIVIDVGSPKGDVLFEEVSQKASFITPVPGGVGPVTIASLLENLIKAAKIKAKGI